jgi:Flp pilus assembly protein TadD
MSRPIPAEKMLANNWDAVKPYHILNFYARAWLLTHELMLDPARKGQLTEYLRAVNEGKSGTEAAAVFGDLTVLDKELAAKVKRREYRYRIVNVPLPAAGSITTRTMTPAESELWAERLTYSRIIDGQKPKDSFFAKVDAVAAKYPDDPFVLQLLAAARYYKEDYAGSEQAADKWLAVAPNQSRALLAKGKARLALVEKIDKPTAEQWKEARSWIVRANRADGNDPLAYIAYFESFVRAGEKPRDAAFQGLERALELAPQDDTLRINLAMQYASGGKYEEAAQVIRPLAYSPHVNGPAETARISLVAFEAKRMPSEEDFKKAEEAAKEGEKDDEED